MPMKLHGDFLLFQPETVSFQAGRIMPHRINELLKLKNDFGFETTLSSRTYVSIIKDARRQGFTIVLLYFWLESVELARARVKERVAKGGHDIPLAVIERRYLRGRENFFALYKDLCDSWLVYDNSHAVPAIVAKSLIPVDFQIYNSDLWSKFKI